jgi:tRNA(Ile)-lysidine synthase
MSINNPKENIDQRVMLFIRRHNLISSGSKILVAVSGGPDSITLLHIFSRLQAELGINLHVAHLNHGLRGTESAADASYVAELTAKMGLPTTIETRDITRYQAEHRLSLEEAAREVRYAFLAQTAREVGAERVAVGHNLNDQVETILLHIIRGTGTRGLRGLQPCSTLIFSNQQLTVIRPLLEIKREEIETYCSSFQLNPCQDTSNLSLSLFRNRIRRELLPLLLSYNPGIFGSLLRISRIAQDDLAFLEGKTAEIQANILCKKDNHIIFDKARLQNSAPALQRQIFRQAIAKLLGDLKDIETRHIEGIMEALNKPAGRQISLPAGLIFRIEYNRCLLGFQPDELVPFPELKGDYTIRAPGKTEIPGWQVEAEIFSPEAFSDNPESREAWENDGFTGYFDHEKVGGNLKLRARRPGDSFLPLGMGLPKKVGEFMVDARIPRAWRARIPILYTPRQIIWIAGWRIDDRVKITEETRQVLRIRLTKNISFS